MSLHVPQCPRCASKSVLTERRPDGNHQCTNCGHRWPNVKLGTFEAVKRELEALRDELIAALAERDVLRAKLELEQQAKGPGFPGEAHRVIAYALVEQELAAWAHPKTTTLMVQFNARTKTWRVWGRNEKHDGASSLRDAVKQAHDHGGET